MIPETLKQIAHWVVWKYIEDDKGKLRKVPFQPHKPDQMAAVTRPIEWSDFETASTRTGFHGVGFVVTEKDNLTGIDLDHCTEPEPVSAEDILNETYRPKLKPWAQEVVDYFDSYCEKTPSGQGVRIWVKGTWKGTKNRWVVDNEGGQIEIYSSKRYFTVTGYHMPNTKEEILDGQAQLDEIASAQKAQEPEKIEVVRPQIEDAELVGKLLEHDTVISLWTGDISSYCGDASRADLALASLIALHTSDPDQIERIFGLSALGQRDKWKKRNDYRKRTVRKALN